MTIVYTISIAIRSLIDLVPDKANRDKNEDTPADESGSSKGPDHLGKCKARKLEEKNTLLDFIS